MTANLKLRFPLRQHACSALRREADFPLQIPAIDLLEVGAGGGSIARIDGMGLLKVGPESAGGGATAQRVTGAAATQPTVTDADLVLGYLNPDYFLGGAMALDATAAQRLLFASTWPSPLAWMCERGAWGIHDIINEQMASAMRIHIAEKGKDPRDYTIVATGGAGPLHAYRIAEKLHIRRILCARWQPGWPRPLGCWWLRRRLISCTPGYGVFNEIDWSCAKPVVHGPPKAAPRPY